jgi:hypothetical protein
MHVWETFTNANTHVWGEGAVHNPLPGLTFFALCVSWNE